MNVNWFLSRTVRHALHLRKHVWRLLSAQRDLLSPEAIRMLESPLQELQKTCAGPVDRKRIEAQMRNVENAANKWLKSQPHPVLRENVEVALVVLAVFLGIRTFIAQPFKIPTGSMQPTLYGVTSTPDFQPAGVGRSDLRPQPDFEVPNVFKRVAMYWLSGLAYYRVVCEADGVMETRTDEPTRFLMFNLKQTFVVGGRSYTVWFPPERFLQRAGLVDREGQTNPKQFKAGEDMIKMRAYGGDHLFVERITYNFRRPRRGEIVVFETKDIEGMAQTPSELGQFYIKRLVALPGEKVSIGDDRHLIINGQRLDASTTHFENVYSFDPAQPAGESRYSGHVNGKLIRGARYFPDERSEFSVPPGHYLVMGDNTLNSYDSRFWGPFRQENVIGRSFAVFWPFGFQETRPNRWGWGLR